MISMMIINYVLNFQMKVMKVVIQKKKKKIKIDQ